MSEHFSRGNLASLCDFYKYSSNSLDGFTEADLNNVRGLLSMRKYIETREDPKEIVQLLCDDDFLISHLKSHLLPKVLKYIREFYLALNCLYDLIHDLPKLPFGKQFREFYCAVNQTENFSDSKDFSETMLLLTMSTKQEFLKKIESILCRIESHLNNSKTSVDLSSVLDKIKEFHKQIKEANTENITPEEGSHTEMKIGSRQELKEKIMERFKQQQSQRSPYQDLVADFLKFFKREFFSFYLISFKNAPSVPVPLIEIFVFSDATTLRKHIVGAPRAALHQALQNPHYYLQCECCETDSGNQLRPTQPDLAIVYKLHLECGKMINLFDWLQAFNAVAVATEHDDADEETDKAVDPLIL